MVIDGACFLQVSFSPESIQDRDQLLTLCLCAFVVKLLRLLTLTDHARERVEDLIR